MLMTIVILKGLLEVAGLALVGQGILYLLAGAGREQNVFYRILKIIAMPAWKVARFITPRAVADQHIGFAAFFLVAGMWLGLSIEKAQQCRQQPEHPQCVDVAQPPQPGKAP